LTASNKNAWLRSTSSISWWDAAARRVGEDVRGCFRHCLPAKNLQAGEATSPWSPSPFPRARSSPRFTTRPPRRIQFTAYQAIFSATQPCAFDVRLPRSWQLENCSIKGLCQRPCRLSGLENRRNGENPDKASVNS
jgi:hypothetical protein